MNTKILTRLAAILLAFILAACKATPTFTLVPTSKPTTTATQVLPPTPTSRPMPTFTPISTLTPTSAPTATAMPTQTIPPFPVGEVDTGMGGNLSIQGVARDDHGNAAPNVFVQLSVYGQGAGWDIGKFGDWFLYTDEQGSYSFKNLRRLARGHSEVWFNGLQEYGKVYENIGYGIAENEIRGDIYTLNVTVHKVTGSALVAVIQYQDVDGSLKNFYSPAFSGPEPGHLLSLNRGTPGKMEYGIGSQYGNITGNTVEWRNLAGGTYYLTFQYRRLDGVLVECMGPSFEISPGETKHFEYTIQDCPPVNEPVLP